MPRVVEINDPRRLRESHLVWQLLLPQTREASFFQTLDWLECYWRHFGQEQRLRLLLVFAGNSPIGIVPLAIRTERSRVGPCRVLTYPLHDWSTRFGPIGHSPSASLIAALQHVRDSRRDWDVIDLRWIDRDAVDHGRTPLAMQQAGFANQERVWKRTACVDLSAGWESYLATRSGKLRSELRRLERRLCDRGELRFERFRPEGSANGGDDPRWDLYKECLTLANRSWQGGSTSGTTLTHASVASFFRESHQVAVRSGAVDIGLLRVDERPIAFAYNYHREGRIIGLRTGFDPEFARFGVGTVLWGRMFEDSCQRGDQHIDLGPDSPQVKKRWATAFTPVYHYRHYGPRPRATLLRIKDWWVDARRKHEAMA